eukprot:TRINITY_DN4132_c0_g1_i1.p1 TRINITY_DN4132_c0_g1~~TRINITY_DN4132_c0_g1_i1.p1  ORF type:complete len:138 (+),score=20.37 TRINITY_DN4132_c0_g1_i1:65-478(+)
MVVQVFFFNLSWKMRRQGLRVAGLSLRLGVTGKRGSRLVAVKVNDLSARKGAVRRNAPLSGEGVSTRTFHSRAALASCFTQTNTMPSPTTNTPNKQTRSYSIIISAPISVDKSVTVVGADAGSISLSAEAEEDDDGN